MSKNIVFGLFICACALWVAVIAWRRLKTDGENVRLFAASAAWPAVPGQIGSVRIDKKDGGDYSDSYHPKIAYTYTVADREYAGTRINFTDLELSSEKEARAAIANYAAGAAVMVAYDPADPQNSVLDRGAKPPNSSFLNKFMFAMAAFLAAIGVIMMRLPA